MQIFIAVFLRQDFTHTHKDHLPFSQKRGAACVPGWWVCRQEFARAPGRGAAAPASPGGSQARGHRQPEEEQN